MLHQSLPAMIHHKMGQDLKEKILTVKKKWKWNLKHQYQARKRVIMNQHSSWKLKLKISRRGESCGANVRRSGSCESSSSSQIDYAAYQKRKNTMGLHFQGTKKSRAVGFDLCEYIASGSDDGRWFIWDKKTGILVKMLAGDEQLMLYSSNLFCFAVVVNCVQCHPSDCTIATSGIDSTSRYGHHGIKPIHCGWGMAGPEPEDVYSVMERNQNRLRHNRDVFCPWSFWSGLGCMNLLKEPYIHLSVLRHNLSYTHRHLT
ncbi:hypothetical protein GIB67_036192, partial [Kingdonia uniflora]